MKSNLSMKLIFRKSWLTGKIGHIGHERKVVTYKYTFIGLLAFGDIFDIHVAAGWSTQLGLG